MIIPLMELLDDTRPDFVGIWGGTARGRCPFGRCHIDSMQYVTLCSGCEADYVKVLEIRQYKRTHSELQTVWWLLKPLLALSPRDPGLLWAKECVKRLHAFERAQEKVIFAETKPVESEHGDHIDKYYPLGAILDRFGTRYYGAEIPSRGQQRKKDIYEMLRLGMVNAAKWYKENRRCPNCGKQVKGGHGRVYCSRKCRDRHHYLMKIAKTLPDLR